MTVNKTHKNQRKGKDVVASIMLADPLATEKLLPDGRINSRYIGNQPPKKQFYLAYDLGEVVLIAPGNHSSRDDDWDY